MIANPSSIPFGLETRRLLFTQAACSLGPSLPYTIVVLDWKSSKHLLILLLLLSNVLFLSDLSIQRRGLNSTLRSRVTPPLAFPLPPPPPPRLLSVHPLGSSVHICSTICVSRSVQAAVLEGGGWGAAVCPKSREDIGRAAHAFAECPFS